MIKDTATAQAILNKITRAEDILLITHQHPDGDGLGALSALALFLQSQGKNYSLFCRDAISENDSFLPLLHQVTSEQKIFKQKFDPIIILDSGSLGYAGVEEPIQNMKTNYTLINIDHHSSNTNFGQLNLVQDNASSASEIVYDLLRLWQAPISKDMATALLNGIIFDTGAFSNAGTTLGCLTAASHLLNLGARHKEINEKKFRDKSLNLLKLWGRAFERLVYNPRYGLAYTIITLKDFRDLNLAPDSGNGLSNFFNELTGAKIIMVLAEQDDQTIKGSLRTTYDGIDVAKLAQAWGGGGHKKAAGFSVKGKLVYNKNKWSIK